MERYTKIKPIGSGTFGQAWLVQSTVSQRKYALKELGVAAMTEQDRYLALNEAKILSKLKHKNIVRYKEAFVDQGKLCIAMEFAEKGDLYTRIRDRNGAHFPETQILEWFTQLCLALKYIHGQNILHRDLKTQNIFLGKDDVIKLGDFGIARMLNSTLDHAQTTVGTPYYLSPEICQRKPYNHKSDMWSLGCVLYEMTTLKHAFNANNFSALVIKILQGQYPPIPGFYGPLLEDLVSVLLKKNPDERPSAKQLLYVPAMQPYVKRFLLSERDRTDSVASDVSDISSATSGPDCSQMSSSTGTDKPKEVTIVADKSISSKQSDQVERNMFVGAARVRKRRLSSNTASTAGGNVCASENRVKEPENLLVNESRSKARENVFVTDNALNRWENVCASSNVSKAQEYFVTSDYAPKPASVNLQKARENLPSRCSVSTRKQGLLALAHAQQRRHSEQNSASCQPGSRIQKARIHSQGAPSREMAETEDDVFAKNQATITPAGSTNQRKVTNSRLNQHVTNVASSRNNKFISLADQRRQKPALSVCEPNCGEEVHTKKRQKSAATVLDRNCWPSEQRNRRVTSRPENNSTDKENRGSLSGHAQVTVKRRVSSTASSSALKPIQASNVEKQQTVKTGPRASGFEHENRKRTYTVSHERRLSEFEIPEVDELRHCSGESKNVSSHDSVYAHMEALRMHLEKELGTRLLTAVYRYITNVSLEEHERVTQTVMCMLGEDKMTYFPVLLQLVACEAIYFH